MRPPGGAGPGSSVGWAARSLAAPSHRHQSSQPQAVAQQQEQQPRGAQQRLTPKQQRLGPLSAAAGYAGASSNGSSTGSSSTSSTAPRSTVKVYEAGKQDGGKRIVAETVVQAPVDVVWHVLTNYERLADFVPNLESCERLPSPHSGRMWIRQRGCSQGMLWRLEAEAVMEVEEVQLPLGRQEARFSMVDGDFKEMSGRWVVEPDPSSAVGMATLLRFDITVQPKIALPSSVVSYVVRAGLPANIQAVARRAEEIATSKLRASGLARWAGTEDDPPIPVQPTPVSALTWEQEVAEEEAARAAATALDEASKQQQRRRQAENRDDGLPSKGPFRRLTGSSFPEAAPLTAERQRQQQGAPVAGAQLEQDQFLRPLQLQQADLQSLYLGVVSVPLPHAGNCSSTQPQTQQELNQRQELKEQLQAAYPAFGLRWTSGRTASYGTGGTASNALPVPGSFGVNGSDLVLCARAAEVHLRRLDTFDTLHRRAVAAITIDAPPEAVWAVLTDYDRLAEFIPNLAVSQRIALPRSAPSNIIRVRQVGYKRMLYMCLHAESVLDLIEKPQSEIQFRQVAGDFERFQGKWMLQGMAPPVGNSSSSDAEPLNGTASQTQLKYAVEIVIPRATRMLGVLEPLLERTVFEDVPTNLAAIKQRVESMQQAQRDICKLEDAGKSAAAAALRRKLERPSLSDMVDDFVVLVAELERCFGTEGVLPARSDLREMNRSDLEKAISAHGGPTVVAQQLGWKLKAKGRRPKGYWDSPENVRSELDEFIEEQGLSPGVMPAKNDFVRALRYDIARAVERWGGLYELAGELGYAVSDSRKPGSSEWQEHISEVAANTGLSGREGLFELAAKTYAVRRSMQGSVDGAEEVSLSDILAAGAVGNGCTTSKAPAVPASSNGSSCKSNTTLGAVGSKAKGKAAITATKSARITLKPSMRDEIDAW